MNQLHAARGKRTLDKYAHLADLPITSKSTWVQYYSRKKTNGEHATLDNPKHNYRLNYTGEQGQEYLVEVPKLVYDQYQVPEQIHDHEPERQAWEQEQAHKQQRTACSSNYGTPYYWWR